MRKKHIYEHTVSCKFINSKASDKTYTYCCDEELKPGTIAAVLAQSYYDDFVRVELLKVVDYLGELSTYDELKPLGAIVENQELTKLVQKAEQINEN